MPHRGIELNFNKALYNFDDIFQISVKEVIYRQSTDFIGKARIYQPAGDGPFPCILDVHGGVWNGGSLSDNARMDQILAESGIVVVAIDYRLAPSHPYPAQVQDVNYATRWVKSQAGLLNIDNSSIGALGLLRTNSNLHPSRSGRRTSFVEEYCGLCALVEYSKMIFSYSL